MGIGDCAMGLLVSAMRAMKCILIWAYFCSVINAKSSDWYEPSWSGVACRSGEKVDVGRGTGSCNTDCDCPSCSPFCSKSGYCQNHESSGRRKILKTECVKDSVMACPPPLGSIAPPGCNKTFVKDVNGFISCNDALDCPQSPDFWDDVDEDLRRSKDASDITVGYCRNNKCSFQSTNSGQWYLCKDETFRLNVIDYQCNTNNDCHI